jgi:hypothetical protein
LTLPSLEGAEGPYFAPLLGLTKVPTLSVNELAGRPAVVVDLDWSRSYYDGHIPGAWFAIRSRLAEDLPRLPEAEAIVFTSSDGALARLAAADWQGKAPARVFALEGGTENWVAAGGKLQTGATHMASAAEDMRLRAREMPGSVEEAMKAYLSWEIALAEQMATDEDQRFRVLAGT